MLVQLLEDVLRTEEAEHLAVGAVDQCRRYPLVPAGVEDVVAKRVRVYHDERDLPERRRWEHSVRVGRGDGFSAVLDVDAPKQVLDHPLKLGTPLLMLFVSWAGQFGEELSHEVL